MKCPKCDAVMETVTFQNVEVDRCTGCQGIFFDAKEHLALKEIKGSDVIDTGSVATGKKMDHKTDVTCPRCGATMTQVADTDQTHITLDACPKCLGVYFDAGEFKDFTHYNIVDYLRGLMHRQPKKK